jgi:Na+/H+-dicarboxylate symporter
MHILQKIRFLLILLSTLLLPLFFGDKVPLEAKSFFYSLSLSMKAILLFVLPFVIFSFIFSCLLSLQSGVVVFVILLISMVFFSNTIAIFTGYFIGSITLENMELAQGLHAGAAELETMWSFSLEQLVSNQQALIAGFVTGIFFSFKRHAKAEKLAEHLSVAANFFLKKIFLPLLPLFILGFVFKLEHEKILGKALTSYGPVFFVIVSAQACYTLFLYLALAGFSLPRFVTYLRNVLPATLTGFSTISSAASMPVLMLCTEKNVGNANFARTIIPAVINIHTLGSALGLTILTLATLLTFDMPIPSLKTFAIFAFFYAIAKFAVAAVPGGVVVVVAPLLETYMGFTPEMVGLITVLYLLFDPFGTATNVTCNGAYAIAFSKVYRFVGRYVKLDDEFAKSD